ncbi:MAG: hypothetical protein AAGE03_02795 [Pseudomonadota bacterium]
MSSASPSKLGQVPVDPIQTPEATSPIKAGPQNIATFEALLRDRRHDLSLTDTSGAAPIGAIQEMSLPVGMMRLTLNRLIARLEGDPDLSRAARAGLWALRVERRKLAILDGYVSGLIRG